MTKRISVLLALSLFLIACGEKAQEEPAAKKDSAESASTSSGATTAGDTTSSETRSASPNKQYFDVESGVVEMKNSLLGGSQVLYFDRFGARQAIISELNVAGNQMTSVQITKDGWAYTYDPSKKTGVKQKMPEKAMTAPTHPDELTDKEKVEYHYKDLEDKTIFGNVADGYSLMLNGTTVKAWTWKKVPLYMELSGATGQTPVVIEATRIDTSADVPESRFDIPSDIKITEQATPSGSVPTPGGAPEPAPPTGGQ